MQVVGQFDRFIDRNKDLRGRHVVAGLLGLPSELMRLVGENLDVILTVPFFSRAAVIPVAQPVILGPVIANASFHGPVMHGTIVSPWLLLETAKPFVVPTPRARPGAKPVMRDVDMTTEKGLLDSWACAMALPEEQLPLVASYMRGGNELEFGGFVGMWATLRLQSVDISFGLNCPDDLDALYEGLRGARIGKGVYLWGRKVERTGIEAELGRTAHVLRPVLLPC